VLVCRAAGRVGQKGTCSSTRDEDNRRPSTITMDPPGKKWDSVKFIVVHCPADSGSRAQRTQRVGSGGRLQRRLGRFR
jgi:hypothetical protein